jgi:hypothetical protein
MVVGALAHVVSVQGRREVERGRRAERALFRGGGFGIADATRNTIVIGRTVVIGHVGAFADADDDDARGDARVHARRA